MNFGKVVVSFTFIAVIVLGICACTTPAKKNVRAELGEEHKTKLHQSAGKKEKSIVTAGDRSNDVTNSTVVNASSRVPEPAPAPAPELFPGTGDFVALRGGAQLKNAVKTNGDYTLNFKGAKIEEVVRSILGDAFHVNYTIDENVKGQVNLQTSEPIAKDSLLPTLEEVLRMVGAVLVKSGSLYKIVPRKSAMTNGLSPNAKVMQSEGFQVLVVPLHYIGAGEMEKILKPFQPTGSLLQVDLNRNLLMLSGSQVELTQLLKMVKTFDVDQLRGMSVGLFPLKSIDTHTIHAELEQVLGNTKDGGLTGMLRFVPIERMNALLVITPQAKYLRDAQMWIERLDRAEEGAAIGVHIYNVQYSRAVHLAELLEQLFETSGLGSERPSPRLLAPGARPVEIATLNRTSAATSLRGGKSLVKASRVLAPNPVNLDVGLISIIADEQSNSLIIKSTAADFEKVERAIKKLDVLPLQVMVEATIVDVELTDEFSFGLEWFFKSSHGDKSGFGTFDSGSPGLAPIAPGFSYAVVDAADIVRGVLNTLAGDSRLDVISSPSLMVLDNNTATIKIGDQVPVRTSEASSIESSGTDTIIASTIQYLDTGVLLEVTPRVSASGMVVMDITQEVNSVETTSTSGIDSPTINQRRIVTTVAVQSGQTIVLGGLIRESKADSQNGVPFLRKVPILGWFAGSQSQSTDRSELIVLITPTAIRDPEGARAITDELGEKMNNLILPEWLKENMKTN